MNIKLLISYMFRYGCHLQGVFQIKEIQAKRFKLGVFRTHCKDRNATILKCSTLISI
jgi:hypothetical protein